MGSGGRCVDAGRMVSWAVAGATGVVVLEEELLGVEA